MLVAAGAALRHSISLQSEDRAAGQIIQLGRATSTSCQSPSRIPAAKTKVPLRVSEQRLIIATCEKGTVEDVDDMKDIKAGLDND